MAPAEKEWPMVPLNPDGRSGWWRDLLRSRQRLRSYRFLIQQLVRVNLHRDFKRSFIGLSWLVILPLIAMAVWILLNGAGIVDPGATDIPYPAYVLLSTSIWGFFMEIYRSTSQMLLQQGRLLVTTPFPQEILVAEQVIVHLIRFSIPFGLNIIVLLFFGVSFTWWALLFPFTLLPLLLLGLGIGLLISLMRLVATDIGTLVDEGMRVLMFLTPVVYTPQIQVGWLSDIVAINPLTYLISFSRDVLTNGTFYEPSWYLLCTAFSLLFFLFALRVYIVAQPRVIERLIAT